MDISQTFRSLSKYEATLLVLFIIYLIFDIQPPDMFAAIIDTPLGMVFVLLLLFVGLSHVLFLCL